MDIHKVDETSPGAAMNMSFTTYINQFTFNIAFEKVHSYQAPDVLSVADYYPFGMQMPGRTWSAKGLGGSEDFTDVYNDFDAAVLSSTSTYSNVVDDQGDIWYTTTSGSNLDLVADASSGNKIEVDVSTDKDLYLETKLKKNTKYTAFFDLDLTGPSNVQATITYQDDAGTWATTNLYQNTHSFIGTNEFHFTLPSCANGNIKVHFAADATGSGYTYSIDKFRIEHAGVGYRFGFNGKEQDSEVGGNGNSYDYGFRIYNPRLAKFLSVDPLTKSYPYYTPYQFAGNKPIYAIDLDGLEELPNFEKLEYGGFTNYATTFTANSFISLYNDVASTWNYGVEVVETAYDHGFWSANLKVSMDAYKVYEGAESYITNTTLSEMGYDVLGALSDVETYEGLTGGLLSMGGGYVVKSSQVVRKLGSISKLDFYDNIFPDIKVPDNTLPELKFVPFSGNDLGEIGESALKLSYGPSVSKELRTYPTSSGGSRVYDHMNLEKSIARESKVGYKTMSSGSGNSTVKAQLAKDLELLHTGAVEEVIWTFYRSPYTGKGGASPEVLKVIQEAQDMGLNIKTEMADLPDAAIIDAMNRDAPSHKYKKPKE